MAANTRRDSLYLLGLFLGRLVLGYVNNVSSLSQ